MAALMIGFTLGYGLRPFLSQFTKYVEPQEITTFMSRIVNAEGARERRTQMVKTIAVSKRRTMRIDGGPPARVHKMRKRKRVLRNPDG